MVWFKRGVLVWLCTGGFGMGEVGGRCLHCLRRDDDLGDVCVVRWKLAPGVGNCASEKSAFRSTPKQVHDSKTSHS